MPFPAVRGGRGLGKEVHRSRPAGLDPGMIKDPESEQGKMMSESRQGHCWVRLNSVFSLRARRLEEEPLTSSQRRHGRAVLASPVWFKDTLDQRQNQAKNQLGRYWKRTNLSWFARKAIS